jgi:hypothetical protein
MIRFGRGLTLRRWLVPRDSNFGNCAAAIGISRQIPFAIA